MSKWITKCNFDIHLTSFPPGLFYVIIIIHSDHCTPLLFSTILFLSYTFFGFFIFVYRQRCLFFSLFLSPSLGCLVAVKISQPFYFLLTRLVTLDGGANLQLQTTQGFSHLVALKQTKRTPDEAGHIRFASLQDLGFILMRQWNSIAAYQPASAAYELEFVVILIGNCYHLSSQPSSFGLVEPPYMHNVMQPAAARS